MKELIFDKNRKRIKYCPCGKKNINGKFVPYVDYDNKGYCFSCDKTFLPKLNKDDYIKPVLWHSVYADYLRDGIVLAANGGIFSHQSEGATLADIESIKYTAKSAQSKADVYISRLNKFLCDTTIVEYDTQDNNYDQDPDSDLNTISGWFLDGARTNNSSSGGGGGSSYLELE